MCKFECVPLCPITHEKMQCVNTSTSLQMKSGGECSFSPQMVIESTGYGPVSMTNITERNEKSLASKGLQ